MPKSFPLIMPYFPLVRYDGASRKPEKFTVDSNVGLSSRCCGSSRSSAHAIGNNANAYTGRKLNSLYISLYMIADFVLTIC